MFTGKQEFLGWAAKTMKKSPTKHEQILDEALQKNFKQLFRTQWVIGDCIADFFSPMLDMVIEVDGSSHKTLRGITADIIKDGEYAKRNYRVLRVTNDQVENNCQEIIDDLKKLFSTIQVSRTRRMKFGWHVPGLRNMNIFAELPPKQPNLHHRAKKKPNASS